MSSRPRLEDMNSAALVLRSLSQIHSEAWWLHDDLRSLLRCRSAREKQHAVMFRNQLLCQQIERRDEVPKLLLVESKVVSSSYCVIFAPESPRDYSVLLPTTFPCLTREPLPPPHTSFALLEWQLLDQRLKWLVHKSCPSIEAYGMDHFQDPPN